MPTVLITGFGPYPGQRFNPTGPLVRALARLRRPALDGVQRVAHVFRTSYAAVDCDLPELIARHHPDILLMFGLAARTPHVRVEMLARNTVSQLLSDVEGRSGMRAIAANAPARLSALSPSARLAQAVRETGVPAKISRDAGRYLCNYGLWRGVEAGRAPGGPRLVAFIHVPKLRTRHRASKQLRPDAPRQRRKPAVTATQLTSAGEAILLTMLAALQRR